MRDIADDTTLSLSYHLQPFILADSITPPPYDSDSLGVSVFSMYVTTEPRPLSLPLTESGRLWRTLAVAQSLLCVVLFLSLCAL